MTGKLQKELVEKYKEYFEYLEGYEGPIIPIQFGFECDDGWYMILDELMSSISNHIWNVNRNRQHELRSSLAKCLDCQRYRLPWKRKLLKKFLGWIANKFPRGVDPMPPIQISQIKEKFGGLCFYYSGGDDYIYGLVSLAESLSYKICENCGSTINVGQTQGWVYTICKKCLNKATDRIKDRDWIPVKRAGLLKDQFD